MSDPNPMYTPSEEPVGGGAESVPDPDSPEAPRHDIEGDDEGDDLVDEDDESGDLVDEDTAAMNDALDGGVIER